MRKFSAPVHRIIPQPAWLIVLFCSLLFAPAIAAERKKAQPPVGLVPPQPVQLTIKVRREGKTEIPLGIHGQANEPLKFLIRTAPQSGKASDPKPSGRETATTIYEPPTDLAITTDRFLYAVQSNAGVSAPVEVSITIVDQPPQLKIPDALDFATVRTGDTASKYLEISNTGGSMAIGEVVVEAPWRIDGKTAYRLGAGEMAIFKLIFAPSTGGKFENVARFTSDNTHPTVLRGMGETSVTASPAEVVLRHTDGDPLRAGTLTLINHTDEPRNLEIKGTDRLQVQPQVTVPPQGRAEVPVQVVPGDVRALQAEIQVVAPDFELRVPVTGAPPGPILRVSPASIAFGKIPIKPVKSARFEIENVGGMPGEVFWAIGVPFRTSQNSALLVPGEKRAFDLVIEATRIGPYHARMQFKAGAQSFEIPVEAEITAVAVPASAASRSATPNTPISEDPDPIAEQPELAPALAADIPREWFSDTKPPAGVEATPLSSTTARIAWPAGLSPAERFRVELRQFYRAADGGLGISWMELAGLDVKRKGDTYMTIIRDLQPGQKWTVRVLPLKIDGTAEARLFAIDFKTPPRASFLPRISLTRGLWFALIALAVWRVVMWWRDRRTYA